MKKKKIVEGAKQYSDYLTKNMPQVNENGEVKYYFSGSLAMLLLSSATSIKPMSLDKKGKVVREDSVLAISEKSKESLAQGVRPISLDVDVVLIDDKALSEYGAKYYNLATVKENCDLAIELCPSWGRSGGSSYFDLLTSDRAFKGYDVAELTMQDGQKVIIADPLSLMVHKFADSIKCVSLCEKMANKGKLTPKRELGYIDKYLKDINDFASIFNGVILLYPELDFKEVVEHILEVCSKTAFSDIMAEDCGKNIKQFWQDAKGQIDENGQKRFEQFIGAVGEKNKEMSIKKGEGPIKK